MRVLVTGGAGYIGSHATAALREEGHEPVVLDDLSEGHAQAVGGCELIRADLADEAAVLGTLREKKPDVVMHFAASAYVGESVQAPQKYYFNNVVNTLKLLRAMRQAGVDLFVFSGSCSVYGIPAEMPITEDFPLQPISPYARTKAAVEGILEDYAQAYGLRYASLRYFNAAGAMPDCSLGEDHTPEVHLVPLVIQAALGKRDRVTVYGTDYATPDGTCIRDYIHVSDLAAAHVLTMEALPERRALIYNLGTGQGHSVREVIDTVAAVSGKQVPAEDGPRRPGDPPVAVASCEKIKRELGWEPAYPSLQQIVETAWRWHSTHPEGFGSSG